jgi:hypothetical protein
MLKGICIQTFCPLLLSFTGCGNSVKAEPHIVYSRLWNFYLKEYGAEAK